MSAIRRKWLFKVNAFLGVLLAMLGFTRCEEYVPIYTPMYGTPIIDTMVCKYGVPVDPIDTIQPTDPIDQPEDSIPIAKYAPPRIRVSAEDLAL